MRCFIYSFIALIIPAIAIAETHIVPDDYPTIQGAIEVAVDGDTILVMPGTYVENIDFKGKIITVQSNGGPDLTVIDGNQNGSVVTIASGSIHGVVGMVLDGFTITNGTGHLDAFAGYRVGGGIYSFRDSPVIINNIIHGNKALLEPGKDVSFGGGISCCDYSTEIRIINNEVYDNWAVRGGGINCGSSMSVIAGNKIHNNSADHGGGIHYSGSHPRVVNNVIYGNHADKEGGGIYAHYTLSHFKNNTVYSNYAGISAGGASVRLFTEVTSCIFWNNTAPADPQIGGDPDVSFCDIQGGWPGEGNIDQDPLFVDPLNGDFRLQQDPCQPGIVNPCVDAGANLAFNLGLHNASTRTDGVCDMEIVDMGFHEGPCSVPTLEVDTFEISEGVGGSVLFSIFGGEPNASREYLILGGISGFEPGTLLPGGKTILPVNWDPFTSLVANMNFSDSLVFVDFLGELDKHGLADAVFDTNGSLPGATGVVVHFACLLKGPPWNVASSPVEIRIIP